jgi:hypothetical protein
VVDRAIERDPASAAAEYGAQFRTDIESFVQLEIVNACVSKGRYEREYTPSWFYAGFTDPSGGSQDSMSLAIGHQDYGRQTSVVDVIREVTPPFSPEQVCEDFARFCHAYHITNIQSDRYAGTWVAEQFGRFGITCEQSAKPKSDLYRDLLPLLNSCRVDLLDNAKLIQQLVGLERRVARGGRDSIDHAPGGHDDIVNAVAGLVAKLNEYGAYDVSGAWISEEFGSNKDQEQFDSRQWRAQQLFGALQGQVMAHNTPRPFWKW